MLPGISATVTPRCGTEPPRALPRSTTAPPGPQAQKQAYVDLLAKARLQALMDSGPAAREGAGARPATSPGGRKYTVRNYVSGGVLLVQQYEIEGMGHAWPGGNAAYPFADPEGPDGSTFMWDFFKQHSRCAAPHPGDLSGTDSRGVSHPRKER
ncbi:hypothetical protein OV207_05875 [Corallococcus sp. BB11-1]|uniref:hypothetical protein n=1 Tax=Corallococcus sp. BB11-1 TaxID=2996783 RepID=UPI00226D8379|nr:hypothetical protein [Corallococcus sp. BB11-1]MCY1030979.1 hypothetical protein [Corallococcus sp. BB11-1]